MEALACIKARRSVRKFLPEKIGRDVVHDLIEHAKWAPSYNNTKIVRYVAIDDETIISTIAETLMASENVAIVKNAPLLLVVSVVTGRSGRNRDGVFETTKGDSWEFFDAGAACQTLCLAAADMGLGSVIMATFDEEGVSRLAELPDSEKIIALLALGRPAAIPAAPRRKDVSEILKFK